MSIHYQKQIKTALFVLVTICAILCAQQYLSARQKPLSQQMPLYSTGDSIPDAAKVGNLPAAMKQCEQLLARLKEAEWDWRKVPDDLIFLPDRQYSENRIYAKPTVMSFVFPHKEAVGRLPESDPKEDDLAFYTSIYSRRNSSFYTGEKIRSHPSGFYIVGLKNGNVIQVPIEDVRLVRGTTRNGILVFPGMAAYDPKALHLPEVEFADGKTSPEREAAFKRDVIEDCPGCSK